MVPTSAISERSQLDANLWKERAWSEILGWACRAPIAPESRPPGEYAPGAMAGHGRWSEPGPKTKRSQSGRTPDRVMGCADVSGIPRGTTGERARSPTPRKPIVHAGPVGRATVPVRQRHGRSPIPKRTQLDRDRFRARRCVEIWSRKPAKRAWPGPTTRTQFGLDHPIPGPPPTTAASRIAKRTQTRRKPIAQNDLKAVLARPPPDRPGSPVALGVLRSNRPPISSFVSALVSTLSRPNGRIVHWGEVGALTSSGVSMTSRKPTQAGVSSEIRKPAGSL